MACSAHSGGISQRIQRGAPGQASSAPRNVPMRERQQRGDAEQADRPGQRLGDQLAHGARIVGDRVVEVEPRRVAQIGQVLPPQRLVEAEALVVLLHHLLDAGMHVAAKLRRCSSLVRTGSCPDSLGRKKFSDAASQTISRNTPKRRAM